MAKSFFDLPEVMIAEILLRLPVKLLLLCKCVCKSWLSILSNPNFIKSQLDYATSHSNPTLVTIKDYSRANKDENDSAVRTVTELLTGVSHEQLRRKIASNYPVRFYSFVKPSLFGVTGVGGSCNGIIFVVNSYHNIFYFWNPSIRQCKKLPSPTTHKWSHMIGFGYDSVSNDYKILRILFEDKGFVHIVQVYSTNADCWNEFPPPTILEKWEKQYESSSIVVNGVLFFTGEDELLSFDLHKEVFGLLPFPSFIQSKRSDVLDFNGSVAMVFETEPGIDLWTLDDVSGEVSWSKKFSIIESDIEMEMWLSGYLGAGLFYGTHLIGEDYMYDIMYDYEKEETTFFGIKEYNFVATLKYIETLVSLDGFEQMEENAN